MPKKFEIRSSAAEFLISQIEGKGQGDDVYYKDNTVWCTQKAMATLFNVGVPAVSKHLKNIFSSGELEKDSVTEKIFATASNGKNYMMQFYNLDAIISVGYRVNSIRAIQFRQWATSVLREFAIRGYVLDRTRMENGSFLGEDYFEHLLAEIREIRLSERRFYQKLTDVYATSMDYNKDAPTTQLFFKRIHNKMHYVVHQHTAAEHDDMGHIVTAVLDFAESRAKRHIPMTMEDWAKRIDAYLSSDECPLLDHAGNKIAI